MRLALRIGCVWFELEFGSIAPVPRRYVVAPRRDGFKLQRRLLRRIQSCVRESRQEKP